MDFSPPPRVLEATFLRASLMADRHAAQEEMEEGEIVTPADHLIAGVNMALDKLCRNISNAAKSGVSEMRSIRAPFVPFGLMFFNTDQFDHIITSSSKMVTIGTGRYCSLHAMPQDYHNPDGMLKTFKQSSNDTEVGRNMIQREYLFYMKLYMILNTMQFSNPLPIPRLLGVMGYKPYASEAHNNIVGCVFERFDCDLDFYLTHVLKGVINIGTAINIICDVVQSCIFLEKHTEMIHCGIYSKSVLIQMDAHSPTSFKRAVLTDMHMMDRRGGSGESVYHHEFHLPKETTVSEKTAVYSIGALISVFFFKGQTFYRSAQRGEAYRVIQKHMKEDGTDVNTGAYVYDAAWKKLLLIMNECLSENDRPTLQSLLIKINDIKYPMQVATESF